MSSPTSEPQVKVEYIEEQPGPHPLGRSIIEHDERSRAFAMRPLLAQMEPKKHPWWTVDVLDQLDHSTCVAATVSGILLSSPYRRFPEVRPHYAQFRDENWRYTQLYRVAQENDPWPGAEPSYYGTSTLAGFKAAQAIGVVPPGWQYRWNFGLQDTLDCLDRYGPVAIGINWYEGFDYPTKRGELKKDGESRGGHDLRLVWYDRDDDEVVGVNSWSRQWGANGRFRMKVKLLGDLLEDNGESATWVPAQIASGA